MVLGSNSFSGSDLIDLLLEEGDYEVVGVSRSPEKSSVFLPYKRRNSNYFSFHQLDMNNDLPELIDLFDATEPDHIVNFAAQSEVAPSWEHPEHWYETNVVSLSKMINFLKDRSYLRKYVHISSPEVYGSCEGTVYEDAPLNPSTPYAASKAAADLHLFTIQKNYEFPLTMIRSTNVYGAHQQLWKIIPRTIIYIKSGKKLQLHGGGKAVKSFIHINDISRGELSVMLSGTTGSIYHLSPESGYSVRDVVEMICDKMSVDFSEVVEIVEERPGQDMAYVIDSKKARNEFNWQPQMSMEDGVNGVVSWINENWDEIKNHSLDYIHKP